MEIARDEVRVMTVHGAKGLEAPIVILADTMTQPAGPRPPRLLELADGAVIWAGRKDDDVAPVAGGAPAALREAEDEYRRLLYVAMTRAADRLIVCGAEGERGRPKGCWYDLVREPLQPIPGRGRWMTGKKSCAIASGRQAAEPTAAGRSGERRPTELPSWLRAAACQSSAAPVSLSPSLGVRRRISARLLRPPTAPPPSAARRSRAGVSCIG